MQVIRNMLYLVLALVCVNTSYALSVVEDDDFPNIGDPVSKPGFVGVLGLGSNTITGSLSGNCGSVFKYTIICNFGEDPSDESTFEVQSGQKIDSIYFTTKNAVVHSGFSLGLSVAGTGVTVRESEFNTTSADLTKGKNLILDSGVYRFALQGGSPAIGEFGGGGGFNLDYSIEMHVSSIPIPATVWLFSSGILGVFAARRCIVEGSITSASS